MTLCHICLWWRGWVNTYLHKSTRISCAFMSTEDLHFVLSFSIVRQDDFVPDLMIILGVFCWQSHSFMNGWQNWYWFYVSYHQTTCVSCSWCQCVLFFFCGCQGHSLYILIWFMHETPLKVLRRSLHSVFCFKVSSACKAISTISSL